MLRRCMDVYVGHVSQERHLVFKSDNYQKGLHHTAKFRMWWDSLLGERRAHRTAKPYYLAKLTSEAVNLTDKIQHDFSHSPCHLQAPGLAGDTASLRVGLSLSCELKRWIAYWALDRGPWFGSQFRHKDVFRGTLIGFWIATLNKGHPSRG